MGQQKENLVIYRVIHPQLPFYAYVGQHKAWQSLPPPVFL